MTDLMLFLVIFLAIGIGYVIGAKRFSGFSFPSINSSKTSEFNLRYCKGLTYLLREEDDEAIDRFITDMEVNNETLDVHLSLGGMLRRKGEFSRAIKVHEHLSSHPGLRGEQQNSVQFELANDYLNSGLLDRAEQLFISLLDTKGIELELRKRSLVSLLEVYEQTQDWLKAIDVADRLTEQKFSTQADEWRVRQAQYCCELAAKALASNQKKEGEVDPATKWVRSALKYDANCVRASLLQAKIDMDAGITHAAIATLKSIPKQDGDLASEMIKPLFHCYQLLKNEEGFIEELSVYLGYFRDVQALKLLFELNCRHYGFFAGVTSLRTFLGDYPGLKAALSLREVLEALPGFRELGAQEPGVQNKGAQIGESFKPVFDELFNIEAQYQCGQCGFLGVEMHWHCPGCQGWVTMHRF